MHVLVTGLPRVTRNGRARGDERDVFNDDIMWTDNNEFKLFFQEYLGPVTRFARHFTGDADVARDIAQDAFIRLHERRDAFDSVEKAKSFLYVATRNACLDHLKHRRIMQEYQRERPSPREEAAFLHEITYQETFRLLHDAIAHLSPRSRAIILHGMNGKNNAEIAEAMQISINTVKTLKKSAYATLREMLKDALSFFPFFL
jgi:RNA polymerase sigma-70 factor (ECF subfamily)